MKLMSKTLAKMYDNLQEKQEEIYHRILMTKHKIVNRENRNEPVHTILYQGVMLPHEARVLSQTHSKKNPGALVKLHTFKKLELLGKFMGWSAAPISKVHFKDGFETQDQRADLNEEALNELYDDQKRKKEDRSWNVVFSAPNKENEEYQTYTVKHRGLTQDEAHILSKSLKEQHLKTMEQRIIFGFHPMHDSEIPNHAKSTGGKFIGLEEELLDELQGGGPAARPQYYHTISTTFQENVLHGYGSHDEWHRNAALISARNPGVPITLRHHHLVVHQGGASGYQVHKRKVFMNGQLIQST